MSSRQRSPAGPLGRPRFPGRTVVGATLATTWFVGVLAVGTEGGLTAASSRMLAIFGAAVVLWITEAIPLAATSIMVILAEILLISDEALVDLPADADPLPYETFFATLAHPVLILFLGGFVLAGAAATYRLDRNLAGVLLRPFGRSPRSLVAGLMMITATLSMFMSNTATTAAMMAIVLPVAAGLEAADPFRTSIVLAVPIAANLGGLGTPVGSPPNAIALGVLADEGIRIDFLRWMALAVPIVIVLLVVAWFALTRRYPAATGSVAVGVGGEFDRSRRARILYVTFGLTVVGWMTEPWHGIPAAIIAFVPVVVLLSTGVLDVDDLRKLNWHVLWLVGGGIALGIGVTATGLDQWFVERFDWGSLPTIVLAGTLGLLAVVLSTLISNSATANLVVPIGVSLAASGGIELDPLLAGVIIAMSCSMAMALPISTPPNAVAYSTGAVATRDLAVVGVVVGAAGWLLVVVVAPPIWEGIGLL